MKKFNLIFVLFFFTSILSAQEKITIWVENFPPLSYKDENGNLKGMITEIVQFLVKDSNVQVSNWIMAPWARAFTETKYSANTLLYSVVRKPDREDLFYWIGPVSSRYMYFFKLRSRTDISVNSLNDVKKYQVGTVYKTAANDFLVKHKIKAQLAPRFNMNILKLLAGRIDLVLDSDIAFKSRVKELNKDYLKFDKIFLADSSKKYYIVLNKNTDSHIVNALQNSFEKMKRKGLLKTIQKKYR